ncbi:SCO family protein [Virgibacillus sp. MSJ-26]|uniref:SCO family protein n=1 Tax=Virgibacillus sp. MSJ-26 TaxID=2841522 RepID=UPI001C112EFF|nr:SCO family protein [Virgibacillus sp. MSJ-26]MBU5465500.1 SCO family protein [Virgibacillus sp. MSJ-26]
MKSFKTSLKLFAFSSILLLALSACGGGENIETTMSEEVPDFEFTTQDNETMTTDDLKGTYWVADFVFTNCTTVCLPMTSNMAYLQDLINEEGLDIQLVSFSVDPDYDSPEVLTEYAEDNGADLDNWTFLTGYDFQTIKELSIKTFKNMVQEPPEGSDQVTHGTSFFLVNPEGEVIKNYNGVQKNNMEDIFEDLKEVSR